MSDAGGHAANWYPDPMGRHEYRYYDGTNWTEHVTSHGRQSIDPLERTGPCPGTASRRGQDPEGPPEEARRANREVHGGGTVFTEPILVVNQKAKLIEVNNEYAISDQTATRSARCARSARARPRRSCGC